MNNVELEKELSRAYDYFYRKANDYDSSENCQNQINNLYQSQQSIKNLGCLTFLLVFIAVFYVLGTIISGILSFVNLSSVMGSGTFIFIFLAIIIAVSYVAHKFINYQVGTKKQKFYQDQIDGIFLQKETFDKRLEAHYQQYSSYSTTPCPVSFPYSNPYIISRILAYIQAGRADTVKEALNCLINDDHNANQTNTNQAILDAARATAADVKKVKEDISWKLR